MKKFLLTLPLLALAPLATAQNATTTPVGAMTYTFNATTQNTSTFISLPLTESPTFSGAIASVGNNTLTFSGTPFSPGALSQSASPYFLRITTGAQAGRTVLVTANSNSTVTVDTTDNSPQTTSLTTSGFSVAAGDQVQIFAGDTLAITFGDNTPSRPLVFAGGTSGLNADTIGIYNKSLSRTDVYFFSTQLGYWRTISSTVNQNNTVIYPESSVSVTRRSNRPQVQMIVLGEVPSVSPLTKTAGSNQAIAAATRLPIDITLSQLSLSNWTKGNSALQADTIGVYNPLNGRNDVYFQRPDNTWRRLGDATTDQSNYVLPGQSGFFILKRGAVSGASSFLRLPLPYTL